MKLEELVVVALVLDGLVVLGTVLLVELELELMLVLVVDEDAIGANV